jgi:hypothetical protein
MIPLMPNPEPVDDEEAREILIEARQIAAQYRMIRLGHWLRPEVTRAADTGSVAAADRAMALDPSRIRADQKSMPTPAG